VAEKLLDYREAVFPAIAWPARTGRGAAGGRGAGAPGAEQGLPLTGPDGLLRPCLVVTALRG